MSEKRFAPTPARRDKAIRDGNVARSPELAGIAAFAGALAGCALVLRPLADAAAAAVAATAASPHAPSPAIGAVAALAIVPLGGAALAASAATFAQGGLHVRAPAPRLARCSPVAGMKRMVGVPALVGLGRAGFALTVALGALLPVGTRVVAASAAASPPAVATLVVDAALRACTVALGVGLVFAIADYAVVRKRWLDGLRMSSEDLKRENRETEGDPHAKARRGRLHRALVRGAIARAREASFVVVNPTHVAVALRYAPPAVPVPEILVRAADAAALRVRAIAEEHAIPIVEDVALARLLFASGEAGRAIPPSTFVAVAQVVAALLRSGALRA